MVQPIWKIVRRFFKKLEIELSHDPALLLEGVYPKEIKPGRQTEYLYVC